MPTCVAVRRSRVGDTTVITSDGEDIGKISKIMLDVRSGRIAYAVLSSGGFLGIGDTLRALPWNALTLDTDQRCFRVDATAELIKSEPGFDKDHLPAMAGMAWVSSLHKYHNRTPYWSPMSRSSLGAEGPLDV